MSQTVTELRCDLLAMKEVFTHPRVGRHQRVRSERRGTVGRERFGFGDKGVVALVVDSRVYKPAVHAPGTVPYGNKSQVRRGAQPERPGQLPPAPPVPGQAARQRAERGPGHPTRPQQAGLEGLGLSCERHLLKGSHRAPVPQSP